MIDRQKETDVTDRPLVTSPQLRHQLERQRQRRQQLERRLAFVRAQYKLEEARAARHARKEVSR